MDAPQAWTVVSLVVDAVKALAWPIVAVIVLFRYKPEIRGLLNRLREGGGAKFDPLPPQGGTVVLSTEATTTIAGAFPHRTPASQRWERDLRAMPQLAALTDPIQREEFLVAAIGRIVVNNQFEIAEAYIYGSQVAMLGYLNIRREGESANTLRDSFYDPAKNQYPEIYGENYSFDSYLGFLQRVSMVTRVDDLVQITEQGAEYLAWRANTGKAPRSRG